MRWTERQRAMLREMGVRLWPPQAAPTSAAREAAMSADRVAAVPARAATTAEAKAERVAAAPAREPLQVPGLAPADWLVVSDRLDDGDPQQQLLLENMLRAIGVGLVAPSRERRAACVTVDAAGGAPDSARTDIAAAPVRAAIDAVRPRCVLAFGRAAAAALLGAASPLAGLRGRVHVHDGVPIVVTFTLAFLLRNPAEKAKAWADLCLAVRALSA